MNDFQLHNKIYSKLSLHKNGIAKLKSKNFPPGLKSIYITNSNGLEISSQYGDFSKNSKKKCSFWGVYCVFYAIYYNEKIYFKLRQINDLSFYYSS